MIPIPRHITLIIINEYNKFSNDQNQKSYYACDVYQEGYVHEYTGEEPFWGPFVCHCGVFWGEGDDVFVLSVSGLLIGGWDLCCWGVWYEW